MYISLERLIEISNDEEKASLMDFIIFFLRYPNAEDVIQREGCDPSPRISLDRNVALALYDMVTKIDKVIELIKKHVDLYKIYERYMLCLTSRILGLKFPRDIIQPSIPEPSIDYTCIECQDICEGKHIDDVKRANTILSYAKNNPTIKIYIATIATIKTRPLQECFTCLVECYAQRVSSIVMLK
ncbi:MAG: hypothetical protein QXE01_02550 [Sulfolobales archaeon]